MDSYVPDLVDQAIADRALAYEGQRLGFEVTDGELAKTIRSLQFGSLPPDQYRPYIEQQLGISVPEFENNMRLKGYPDSMQMIAMEGVIVTPAEVEAEYRKRNDKIKLDYIAFDPIKLAAEMKPTPEELKAYFDATTRLLYGSGEQGRSVDRGGSGQSGRIHSDFRCANSGATTIRTRINTGPRSGCRRVTSCLSTTNKPQGRNPEDPSQGRGSSQADSRRSGFRASWREKLRRPRYRPLKVAIWAGWCAVRW